MYGDAALSAVKFFHMDELMTQSTVTPSDYKTLYPLFTLDDGNVKEKLKFSVVDIQLKANFTENVHAHKKSICTGYFRQDVVIPIRW